MIEVELRGLLTQTEYEALGRRLAAEGVAAETDDKNTYFFNVNRGVFKVCDEISKGRGKLSLKIGSEETGALQEREIIIDRGLVPPFLEFFAGLGYAERHLVPQKRRNYFLEGATLSLKFTPDFQYHFELEGNLLEDESQVEGERQKLLGLCGAYGLIPLRPEEIVERVRAIRRRIGFDQTP
jgi:adenylate cyclase class IV